jgi:hypothetical protein
MKAVGYVCLHYGKDYLEYSLRSVYSEFEHIFVLYTPNPSHGHKSRLTCPDTEQELMDICAKVDVDNKISWRVGHWTQENHQRDYAYELAKTYGADILGLIDFDEVWKTEVLRDLIKETYEKKASKCLVWMKHLWRSFDHICEDAMRQERLYYLGKDKQDLIYASQTEPQVWHFGYARMPIDVEYKMSIHGHKSELLANWYHNKFLRYPFEEDSHPTRGANWIPTKFDKTLLPDIMKEHPYYNLPIIG